MNHFKAKNDDFIKFKYPFDADKSVERVQKSKLVYRKGTDRDGRPVAYARLRNFFPSSKITDKDY